MRVARTSAVLLLLAAAAACSSDSSESTSSAPADIDQPGATEVVEPEDTTPPSTETTVADSTTTTESEGRASTTTTTEAPTTTTAATGNQPALVTILMPSANAQFYAEVRGSRAVADVSLSAEVIDPEGEEVTLGWVSDLDGDLGFGPSLDVVLSTGEADVGTHTITATAVDASGNVSTATVMIQVILPSS